VALPEGHPLEHPGVLGYAFTDQALLRQALTHRSFGQPHNERLEFIGDSVLNCVIAEALYRRHPSLPEGELSRLRSSLVNQTSLAARGRALDVGARLMLGEGEVRSGGAQRASMLADAVEALIGGVFLDGGFDRAREVVLSLFEQAIDEARLSGGSKDPKTSLQEWLQARRMALPEYRVVAVNGEAHQQSFDVECVVKALGESTHGSGTSRRAAEQAAALQLLERVRAGHEGA
jgi:ribonuclease-3